MKLSVLATLAGLIVPSLVAADCEQVSGNYYCNEVSKIIYENIGFSGLYNKVTAMDETSGSCSSTAQLFLGSLSPLDEELSVHFRGPLKLLQFGVYYPASASASASASAAASAHAKRAEEECEQHFHHQHKRATAVELVTNTVYATAGAAAAAAVNGAGSAAATAAAAALAVVSSAAAAASAGASASASASSGDWVRSSYYTPGSASNLVFLNNYGGSGSGVWSLAFGNSLSYANSDASGGSSSAVALEECTISSNVEFSIFSGSKCASTDDCGFYRTGSVAYHGFGGAEKIFVFEFEMPLDSGSTAGINGDMPAIWMLNAQIPRTLQYGDSLCSCWTSGCGEFDIFEILSAGSNKLISHLHDKQGGSGGGSSDYFARPTSGSMKAAVIFTGSNIHIQTVSDDFGSTLSSSTVAKWVAVSGTSADI